LALEFNHKCIICSKLYDACDKCDALGHWKSITCSLKCFEEYLRILDERENPKIIEVEIPLIKSTKKSK